MAGLTFPLTQSLSRYAPNGVALTSWEKVTGQLFSAGGPKDFAADVLPLLTTVTPARGAIAPTFTRASTKRGQRYDSAGYLDFDALSGEVVFTGARRVQNLFGLGSENYGTANWTKTNGAFSGNTFTASGASAGFYQQATLAVGSYIVWARLSCASGTVSTGLFANGVPVSPNPTSNSITVTTTPTVFSMAFTVTSAGTVNAGVGIYSAVPNGQSVFVDQMQLENVTGQTVQTAAEYVSVGALDYRSEQNPLYLSLPGTAGHYASTPDSVANSITGDIAIVVDLAPVAWNSGGNQTPIGKIQTTTTRSYFIQIDAIKKLTLVTSVDGTAGTNVIGTSSTAVTFADGQRVKLAFTLDVDNGSTQKEHKFFTSIDSGASWQQLGTTVVSAGTTSIFDSNSILEIGAVLAGASQQFNGKIYSAQVFNGIPPMLGGAGSAAPVVDFNPHRDAVTPAGMITSSTTGEVWTINGASSVVRSAAYHGSCVDGVKCFPTDASGNPISTATTYDAVTLNGMAGTYVSTPDSVANSITGDIDIRVNAALANWTPSGDQTLFAKHTAAGSQLSYGLVIDNTTGYPRFYGSLNGTTLGITTVATAAPGFANGTTGWVRATRIASTGVINFYKSADGITWSQVGTADLAGSSGALNDSSATLKVGQFYDAGTAVTTGRIYRAQIYNVIGGATPVVDFDASKYNPKASATTIQGNTGETWTLNGSATLYPANYPLVGYWPEETRTNLILQSNSFTTTWVDDSLTPVQNVTGPDGATSAWTFTDSNGAYTCRAYQSTPTLTAAAYTLSLFVKKTTGVQTAYPVIQCYPTVGSANMALVGVDTSSGVATAWTAFTGFTMAAGISASCESFNSSYWRVSLTFTGTASAYYVVINPAATTNATQSTGAFDVSAQGTHVFYGAQLELSSFASSYIPTTTVAVQRQADVLTYTGADVANIKAMACSFIRPAGVNNTAAIIAVSDGTVNNIAEAYLLSPNTPGFQGLVAAATQWNTTSGSYTPGSASKMAQSFATNDIKMDKDGTAFTPDTVAVIPTVTQLNIGHVAGSFQLNGPVNNVYCWTRNLSQSELGAVDK